VLLPKQFSKALADLTQPILLPTFTSHL